MLGEVDGASLRVKAGDNHSLRSAMTTCQGLSREATETFQPEEENAQEAPSLRLHVAMRCVLRERPGDGDDPKSPERRPPLQPPPSASPRPAASRIIET